MTVSPAPIIPQAAITTATTPVPGTLQPYNAAAAPLAPILPPLSTVRDFVPIVIEKDSLDTTTNAVTATCAGTDTFASGRTSIALAVPGEKLPIQAATIGGVRVWKVMHGRYVPQLQKVDFFFPGNLTTATGNVREPIFGNWSLYVVLAMVNGSPAGASVIADVAKNGTSIYTISANRPTVTAGGTFDTAESAATTTFTTGDYLTANLLQVGSTTAGSDLTLQVWLRRTD